MPLDLQQTRLADIASWHGITPIPNEVLEAHKAIEVEKRPGSWWFYHPHLANFAMRIGFMVAGACLSACVATMAIACTIENWRIAAVSVCTGLACFLILKAILKTGAMTIQGAKIHGPARWEEYLIPLYGLHHVPEPIHAIAARIMEGGLRHSNIRICHSDMQVVYGKLVQDHVTVDPYLAIRRGDDQIVIGIWDDRGIIHQATLNE
jgi:hypothetical protein